MRAGVRFVFAVAVFTLFLCPLAFSQDAQQLLHKMQDALGGSEKIAAIRDFEQTVRADTWDNTGKPHGEVRKRTRWMRPNLLRLDQVGPDDTYVLYFNGTSGWEILPDKSVADLIGGELKFAQNYLRNFDLNLWLADRDPIFLIKSPAPHVVAITIRGDPSRKLEITLDPITSLPMKQTSISLADPNNPVPSETRYDKWMTVDGVKFPEQISIFHNNMKLAEIMVLQTKLNGGIKADDIATKPPDLKPVMSQLGN